MSLTDFFRENWPVAVVPVLGLVAIYLLLPRPKRPPILLGAFAGIATLLLAGFVLVRVGELNIETFLFYVFSAVALLAGALLITQTNPARAALSFALVVLATCGLFLLQASPFLMAATIIVYAGAIIVTFLFVLMLAQQEGVSNADSRSREPFLASLTGFLLLGALLYVLKATYKPDLDQWVNETTRKREQVVALREKGDAASDKVNATLADLKTFVANYKRWLKNEWHVPGSEEEKKTARLKSPPPGGKELLDALVNVEGELPTEDGRAFRPNLASLEEVLVKLEQVGIATRNDPQLGALRPRTNAPMSELSGPSAKRRAHLPPRPQDMDPKIQDRVDQDRIRTNEIGIPHLPAENTMYLGRSLFTDYLLALELAGTLLLVAVIGAIAISQQKEEPRKPLAVSNATPPRRTR